MNDFRKQNDLDGSQGDLSTLGHPQRPRQAKPWGVQQKPLIFIQNWHGAWLYSIFTKTSRFKWSQRSRCSRSLLITLGPIPIDYLKHISNDYFWPRINYLSCTWRLALRASYRFLQCGQVYGCWHAKFHRNSWKIKTNRNLSGKATEKSPEPPPPCLTLANPMARPPAPAATVSFELWRSNQLSSRDNSTWKRILEIQ